MTPRAAWTALWRCERGTMAIETVLVVPVLALLAMGTYEVSTMVSRQQELQSAASEAEGIILATAATPTGAPSDVVEDVIEDSMGLDEDQVTLEQRFRCNTSEDLILDASVCDPDEPIAVYVLLTMTDSYNPRWTYYGIGEGFDYNVQRTIMVR